MAKAPMSKVERQADAGADPVGGLPAACDDVGVEAAALERFGEKVSAENLRHEEGCGGNTGGHDHRQPEENRRRQETRGDGGRCEGFLAPLPVVEREDDATGGRSAEGRGPGDAGRGIETVCGGWKRGGRRGFHPWAPAGEVDVRGVSGATCRRANPRASRANRPAACVLLASARVGATSQPADPDLPTARTPFASHRPPRPRRRTSPAATPPCAPRPSNPTAP
jgi:hypothetical protein